MYGLDYLGGAKFGDLLVREHPAGWAAGFFANTFGNAWPVIEKLLATGRCPRVRIHAVWDDAHRYRPSEHDPVIKREAQRAAALAEKFPSVIVFFSPFCEHSIKGRELHELFRKVREWAGKCILVNSVWTGDTLHGAGVFNEVHGTHKKPQGDYIYSFDGLSAVDSDVEKIKRQYSDAHTFYFWHPAFNGRLNTNDKTPRPQRKAWPTSELIDSLIYLRLSAGEVKLPRNYLWKSHADRHNTPPEPRAYKPVLIMPPKVDRVELVADNGQVVAVSSRAQPFSDGRFRYYWDSYGYQIAEKARRIHGKPTCSLRVGGKIVGSLNPGFRAGAFR